MNAVPEKLIQGVKIKTLRHIKDERGYLMEIMRSDWSEFKEFGQVYVTVCNPGYAKAWHYHKNQTDSFVVVKNNAVVVLYDARKDSPTHGMINEFRMGEDNPLMLQIPKLVYHGFKSAGN